MTLVSSYHCISSYLTDMIKRKCLRTRSIKMLVLDEADEMLNKGFKEQIYDVYRYLPPSTQVNAKRLVGDCAYKITHTRISNLCQAMHKYLQFNGFSTYCADSRSVEFLLFYFGN